MKHSKQNNMPHWLERTAIKLPVTILLSFLLVLPLGGAAQAIPVFGTGVGFDSNFFSGFTGVTEGVAFGQLTLGQPRVDVTSNTVFGAARARATATASAFSLGAAADSIGAPFSRTAYAFAASGFTLSGTSQSFVNLTFTLDGGIFPVSASGRVERGSVGLWIYAAGDGNGGPVAQLDFSMIDSGEFWVNINDRNGQRNFQVGNQPNLSLSAAVPANGPFLAMLMAGSQGANVDFLSTATLTGVELPLGATLTLDTGQVFGSVTAIPEPSAVPEPGTFVLLALGVTGLAVIRRRKNLLTI